jgi:AcrR family transcriptional regulator
MKMSTEAESTQVVAAVDENLDEPVWQQRAIDRSTQSARQRAAKRVQRFLNSAREIIAEKQSTEFTVQEVVDRSKQSLRSFYQYFNGKHELLLALFEEEMAGAVARLKASSTAGDPLDRLKAATLLLHELCTPGRVSEQALYWEFAQRLLLDHPEAVAASFAPQIDYIAEIMIEAADAGLLRPGKPRRMAAIVLQTATMAAGRSAGGRQPVSGDEVWQFCLHAICPDDVADKRL